MKIYFSLLLLVISCQLNAQIIERQAIASGGSSYISGNLQLNQTLGEAFTSSHKNSSASLLEGYQQADVKILSVGQLPQNQVSVFPNPVSNWIKIESALSFNFLRVYDMQGKLVQEQNIEGSTIIELSHLSIGMYQLVLISNQQNQVSTHQIHKI